MRPGLSLLVTMLLSGCDASERPCVDLRPTPLPNHLHPVEVAVDAAAGLAWSAGLASPHLAVIDLQTGSLLHTLPALGGAPQRPLLAVDEDGLLWLLADSPPQVQRLDRRSGERIGWSDRLSRRGGLAPVPGGVVLSGAAADGTGEVLLRLDLDGQERARVALDGRAPAILSLPGSGSVAVLTAEPAVELRDAWDLSLQARCPLPFEAQAGAALDDGTLVLASTTALARLRCPGDPAEQWAVGREVMAVVSLGDAALALDRMGPGGAWDVNAGLAWRLDGQAAEPQPAFATGKNTGSGAVDPASGLLWVPSEGSTEVQAYDPQTGERRAAVRTGAFVDGLAVAEGQAWATGRLSDTLVRVEDGALAAQVAPEEALRWPYAPTLDPGRQLLWVLSQSDAVVAAFDARTLQRRHLVDLGAGSNPLLVFGDLLLDRSRDRLYVAESATDRVYVVDPEAGVVTASWELGGPPVADLDQVGELALIQPEPGGALLVARSSDGRLLRLDPDTGATERAPEGADGSGPGAPPAVDFVGQDPDRGLLYLGGQAFALHDLARRPEHDLPISHLVGPVHDEPGAHYAIDESRRALLRLGPDGQIEARRALADQPLHALVARVDAADGAEDGVWLSRARSGSICRVRP